MKTWAWGGSFISFWYLYRDQTDGFSASSLEKLWWIFYCVPPWFFETNLTGRPPPLHRWKFLQRKVESTPWEWWSKDIPSHPKSSKSRSYHEDPEWYSSPVGRKKKEPKLQSAGWKADPTDETDLTSICDACWSLMSIVLAMLTSGVVAKRTIKIPQKFAKWTCFSWYAGKKDLQQGVVWRLCFFIVHFKIWQVITRVEISPRIFGFDQL